jgi:uncharacterized protein
MPSLVTVLVVLGLHLAAGWMVFIYVLNRLMNRMRGSWLKLMMQLSLLALFTLAPLALGWAALGAQVSGWRWAFPAAVGVVLFAGEVRLARQRGRHTGALPVDIQPPPRQGWAFLRRPVTTTDLTTLVYDLPWEGPAMKLVHLTDLHLNHALTLDYFRRALAFANQEQPDAIFLSGDFVTHREEIALLPDLLSELRTSGRVCAEGMAPGRAIFASLGNHDYWSDPAAVRDTLLAQGIAVLSGRCMAARLDGCSFRLCADDRPWGPGLNAELISDGGRNIATLILSHSPDNIFELARIGAPAAVFSGHVHGGQFRLPLHWNGASTSLVLPSAHGRRLDRGHFVFDGANGRPVHLFVSAGIGAAEPPLRIYCPPEILVVRFQPGAGDSENDR